ncbi:MAG: hypothetical protein LUG16_03910, partial [Candidatus Gastranaerophilales bacterium]|nr:hypothetical protein [Candidatus Gastranaerophilales bacterium]
MDEIKKILLCGLGGLGSICAAAISDTKAGELKVLVDSTRFERYKTEKTYFNNKEYGFDFVLPEKTGFKADLIIIATKTDGLDFAINNIKNFVHKDTIIISLLNGIHSDEKISEIYKDNNVFITFYIGHSCIREGRNIYQDGTYEFVIGTAEENKKEFLNILVSFFDKANIHYRLSENIKAEYWRKFMINVGINQLSAVTGLTLKDIKKDVLL